MNVSNFKAALKNIEEKKIQSVPYVPTNTINIISYTDNPAIKIRDHAVQELRNPYDVVYSLYNDLDYFFIPESVSKDVSALFPKMFNWRYVNADLYIWLDGNFRLASSAAIDWLLTNAASGEPLIVFKHPTRANIFEEVDYIETEINAGNEEMIKRYDINALKRAVQECVEDFPYIKSSPLLDSRAFMYRQSLIMGPRKYTNFMNDWFTNTVTKTMNDNIGLLYTLSYSRIRIGAVEEALTANNFIKQRI